MADRDERAESPDAPDAAWLQSHEARLAKVSGWSATLGGALAALALAAEALGVLPFGLGAAPELPMLPVTATLVLLASVAFGLLTRSGAARTAGWGCAAGVVLVAAAALADHAFGASVGIDRLPARGAVGAEGFPYRPPPNSALCLLLLGVAMLVGPAGRGGRWRAAVSNALSATGLAISLAAIVGHVYGAAPLHSLADYRGMALGAAVALALLAAAMLLRPRVGMLGGALVGRDAGAVLARRLLPAALGIPFTLGVLKRIADTAGWFDPPVGTALRTIAEMVLLTGLTLLTAGRLRRVDAERERLMADERASRAMAEHARLALEEQAQQLEEQAQQLEEQAQELEEQAVELEATVDELRSANETLDAQRAVAEEARAAELHAKHLLDAVIDQIPVGVVIATIPSGEVVRRNRMVGEIVAALELADGGGRAFRAMGWHRQDGTPYTAGDFPLNRAVSRAETIDREEMVARLSDGTSVHLAVSAAPVYERGEAVMAVAAFMDISTLRAAESSLSERDEVLRSFSSTPDVMLTVVEADVSQSARARRGADYRVLMANAQAASVFGMTEQEVAGKTAGDLGVPAENRRSLVDLLAEVHRTGKPVTAERQAAAHLASSPKWFSAVVSPVAAPPGALPRFCVVATDVTRRKQLEDQLRQAQKLEAVGRLAGGIAHDFNNLLTAITGFTQFALTDLPPGGEARDDLEQALRAAERAAALTRQLLAFSRQQVLQPQVLDLNRVVEDIEPMLRRVIGEDIVIHRALAPRLSAVRADRSQLEQVLVNLVVNARDAMPNGGVLTIETANVDRDAAQVAAEGADAGSPGPHVMLAVTDTGVGMARETLDLIFEPFFTTKEPGRGTGLGLATVFGIVKQSGGSISVYSEPGHGTTFRIYLPCHAGAPENGRAPTPISNQAIAARILLVEDDAAVRAIAARVLRRAGYDVVEAKTGRDGLAVCRELDGRVDLILTDLVLPEMGGRAMIQQLASHGAVPPVLYMSGYTAEAMSAQSVLEPGDHFLEKPFTPASMLARVRETLQASGAR